VLLDALAGVPALVDAVDEEQHAPRHHRLAQEPV
jgi:hypothetical protein